MRIRRYHPVAAAIVMTALSAPVLWRSVRTALIVGLLLNLVNHGGTLVDGQTLPWMGVLLNFLIPFCVSAYSGANCLVACGGERRRR